MAGGLPQSRAPPPQHVYQMNGRVSSGMTDWRRKGLCPQLPSSSSHNALRLPSPLNAGYRISCAFEGAEGNDFSWPFTSRIFIYSFSTVAHGIAWFFQSSCPLPDPLPEEKWLPFLRITLQFMYGHKGHSCLFIKQIETSVFDKICSTFKYREVPICW